MCVKPKTKTHLCLHRRNNSNTSDSDKTTPLHLYFAGHWTWVGHRFMWCNRLYIHINAFVVEAIFTILWVTPDVASNLSLSFITLLCWRLIPFVSPFGFPQGSSVCKEHVGEWEDSFATQEQWFSETGWMNFLYTCAQKSICIDYVLTAKAFCLYDLILFYCLFLLIV